MERAKFTGNYLQEGDTTLIEVQLGLKKVYAAVCLPMGTYFVPSQEWVEKHSGKYLAWIDYENGNRAHPVVVGFCPLKNKTPERYPRTFLFETEKVKIEIDDQEEYIRITPEWAENRTLEINRDTISLGSAGNSAEPGVLGDKNFEALKETAKQMNEVLGKLDTLVGNLQTYSSTQVVAAAPGTPLSPLAAGYTALGTNLIALKTQITGLKVTISNLDSSHYEKTKSEHITLD